MNKIARPYIQGIENSMAIVSEARTKDKARKRNKAIEYVATQGTTGDESAQHNVNQGNKQSLKQNQTNNYAHNKISS